MDNSGLLWEYPILDIAGTEYEINIESYYWYPAEHGSTVKVLELSKLEVNVYDDYSHYGYFDLKKKELIKGFPEAIKEYPEDVIAIEFPRLKVLDPRRFAKMNGLPIPSQTHQVKKFTAKVISIEQSDLFHVIQENREKHQRAQKMGEKINSIAQESSIEKKKKRNKSQRH